MKNTTIWIIGLVIIIIIGVGVYFMTKSGPDTTDIDGTATTTVDTTATSSPVVEDKTKTVLGTSVQSRDITAYHYGAGSKEIVFIGGIHGGYEWNTSLVAYQLMDYLQATPTAIPANVRVTVIPVVNPDGLAKVVSLTGSSTRFAAADVSTNQDTLVSGRFNANTVDLNRNFDCDWQASGKWQTKTVSGGSAAFSEPESQAVKSYIESRNPAAVVVWYSAAGGVFASNCHDGVLPETTTLTNLYSAASGYRAYKDFNFYEITGDMVNWLAKKQIPAISVLLTDHTNTEWEKNKKGIDAVLKHYAQ